MNSQNYILGIDTSCDDTSFAIVQKDSGKVLSNVVSSQVKLHTEHGGIVPELASREHVENLSVVCGECLDQAGVLLSDLSAVAVTHSPGLIGCLLAGVSFAQGLSYQLQVPLYAVNHLEAHLFSPFIQRSVVFPFLGVVVSGGHTAFYRVSSVDCVELIGQTVDDAAGEAFDKCAKMLGLGYPGGPVVDQLAQKGDERAFTFPVAKVKMGAQYLSFSGLKTAVHHQIQSLQNLSESVVQDVCAGLQSSIVRALCEKARLFLSQGDYQACALSGGVAMNSWLRRGVSALCGELGVECHLATPEFCTDNGAMVAHMALIRDCVDEQMSIRVQASQKIQARQLCHEKLGTTKS